MMRAQAAPRKVYTRNGVTHICFQGLYFRAPKGSKIDPEREVNHIESLDKSGGKHRISLTQKVQGKNVTETWVEGEVPVQGRRKQGRRSQGRAAASA
jgi:hypothetical protein